MKKCIIILLWSLLPFPASAVDILNCDADSYKIIILSDGTEREVSLKRDETFSDPGDMLSFQIEGITPVMMAKPQDKFCMKGGTLTDKHCCRSSKPVKVWNGVMLR